MNSMQILQIQSKEFSLIALCRACTQLLSIVMLLLFGSGNLLAKNNCAEHASPINPAILMQSGIGGTGIIQTQSGIGGTGIQSGGTGGTGYHASGIGGTGHVASDGGIGGTGIVGTITGFASICVNGVEIHYDSNVPITVDGQPSTISELAVGQIIAARTLGTGDELVAQNIAVIHAAVGPISHIDLTTGQMQVLDQKIQIERSENEWQLANLKTGDWVRVSGHRLSNETIAASRIEASPPLAEARVNGHINQVDATGFEVNGTRVYFNDQLPPTDIARGMEVQVTGHWDGAMLQAQHIQTEPILRHIVNVEQVVIEGYVHALDNKTLNLNHRTVTLDTHAQISNGAANTTLKPDQRIQINGRLDAEQHIVADRIELKNEVPVQLPEINNLNLIDSRGDRPHKNTVAPGHDRQTENPPNWHKQENQLHPPSHDRKHGHRGEQEQDHGHKHEHGHGHLDQSHDNNPQNHAEPVSIHSPEIPRELETLDRINQHRDSLHDRQEQNLSESMPNDRAEPLIDPGILDRVNDHRDGIHDRQGHSRESIPIDRPEHPADLGIFDRAHDHRDHVRDFDIPDRIHDHREHFDRHHFDR